ncbi:hypothetical protein K3495_g9986 [Podosphaera aphanis]|nr:hypothetical protein K3495_g9986 [Podosphaera aphanis]
MASRRCSSLFGCVSSFFTSSWLNILILIPLSLSFNTPLLGFVAYGVNTPVLSAILAKAEYVFRRTLRRLPKSRVAFPDYEQQQKWALISYGNAATHKWSGRAPSMGKITTFSPLPTPRHIMPFTMDGFIVLW